MAKSFTLNMTKKNDDNLKSIAPTEKRRFLKLRFKQWATNKLRWSWDWGEAYQVFYAQNAIQHTACVTGGVHCSTMCTNTAKTNENDLRWLRVAHLSINSFMFSGKPPGIHRLDSQTKANILIDWLIVYFRITQLNMSKHLQPRRATSWTRATSVMAAHRLHWGLKKPKSHWKG